jgi:hypothetical protein
MVRVPVGGGGHGHVIRSVRVRLLDLVLDAMTSACENRAFRFSTKTGKSRPTSNSILPIYLLRDRVQPAGKQALVAMVERPQLEDGDGPIAGHRSHVGVRWEETGTGGGRESATRLVPLPPEVFIHSHVSSKIVPKTVT